MLCATPAIGASSAVAAETETTLNCAQFMPEERHAFTGTTVPAAIGPTASCCVTIPLLALELAVVGALTPLVTGVHVTTAFAVGVPFMSTRPRGAHCIIAPAARYRSGVSALMDCAACVCAVNCVATAAPFARTAVTVVNAAELAATERDAVPFAAVPTETGRA